MAFLKDYTRDYNREAVPAVDENSAQDLGLQLIYHLQTLQCIDQLREYHLKGKQHGSHLMHVIKIIPLRLNL